MRGRRRSLLARLADLVRPASAPRTRVTAVVPTSRPAGPHTRGAAVVRAAARRPPQKRTVYAGAEISRLTADFITSILSADQEIRGDLRLLRARARALARDNPHAVQFLRLLKTNVVGPAGIRLQARIRDANNRLDRSTNAAIEDAWRDWGMPETCALNGRDSFVDIQNLLITTLATDGEFLIRRRVTANLERNPYGYALELLDPDLLDELYNTGPDATGNRISMGVEIDPDGRAVAYHLWTAHPADGYEGYRRERVRVPASEIIHGYVPLRAGQRRGVPWFTPVLLSMRMLEGYFEAETVAARLGAMKQGFISSTAGDGFQEPIEGQRSLTMDAEPGQLHELLPGQSFTPWNPDHPVQAFDPFTSAVLRAIASGLGAAYMSLTGDISSASYSSARVGLLQERDLWLCLHTWVTTHVHRPVYRDWLKFAATTGAIRLPTLEPARWSTCIWMARGWPWVDPLKDVQADAIALRIGLATRTQLCAERGLEFEEVLEQLAEEQDLAQSYGVVLNTDYNKPVPVDTNAPAAGDGTSTDGASRVLSLRATRRADR